jgi:hypothetical protein
MASIDSIVHYKWTPSDQVDAQKAAPGALVTAYKIPLQDIPDAKRIAAGTSIDLPLARYADRPAVRPYSEIGDEFRWEKLEEPITVDMLEQLCKKLHGDNPTKYPARYYDVATMSLKDRHAFGVLLFNYWKNTAYRYALIKSGKFGWGMLQDGQDTLKLLVTRGLYKDQDNNDINRPIGYLLVRGEVVGAPNPVAAGPTSQTLTVTPPILTQLDADVHEIRVKARRIAELVEKSRAVVVERVRLGRSFTALRTLLDQCLPTGTKAALAKKLEDQVDTKMRTMRSSELLAAPGLSPALTQAIRQSLGSADDMAAELHQLCEDLRHKFVEDAGFTQRTSSFAREALEGKLQATGTYLEKRDAVTMAMVDAAIALLEGQSQESFTNKLWEILKRVPSEPVTNYADLTRSSALDVLFGIFGTKAGRATVASAITSSVGNVAGPSSAWIAWIQYKAWNKLQTNIGGNAAVRAALLKDTVADMLKGMKPTSKMIAELTETVEAGDQVRLSRIKKDVLDEYTGQRQGSLAFKGVVVVLQVVSLLMAKETLDKKVDDSGATKSAWIACADFLGLMGQAGQAVVGLTDVVNSAIASKVTSTVAGYAGINIKWVDAVEAFSASERTTNAIGTLGMNVGAFAAIVGALASAIQLVDAAAHHNWIGMISPALALSGNVLIAISCLRYLAKIPMPVPQYQAWGQVLLVLSTVPVLVQMGYDAIIPGPNKIATAILKQIEDNRYFFVMLNEGGFKGDYAALKAGCEYKASDPSTALPLARNNMFVTGPLLQAGFLAEHIAIIVENVGAPITFSGALPV